MSKLLNMSWRYNAGGFWESAESMDYSGYAKYSYGDSIVTDKSIQLQMPDLQLAEELEKFILHISTYQWQRGYNAAIAEMEYVINGMKEE